jgi:hypothetical protein
MKHAKLMRTRAMIDPQELQKLRYLLLLYFIVNFIYSAENEKLQELNAKVAELQKETNELTSELDATVSERDETKFVVYFLNILFCLFYYRRNVDKIDAERKSMTSKFQAVNFCFSNIKFHSMCMVYVVLYYL